jgi:hypothetical protein
LSARGFQCPRDYGSHPGRMRRAASSRLASLSCYVDECAIRRRPKKPVRTIVKVLVTCSFVSGFDVVQDHNAPVSARCGARWRRNSYSVELCACVVFGGRSQAQRRRTDGRGVTVLNPCKSDWIWFWGLARARWDLGFSAGIWIPAGIWTSKYLIPAEIIRQILGVSPAILPGGTSS